LYLKKIVINGFKSFPNKKEFIIDHGITGIVGPNGSGKSNVADAVRWVLGEQSAKQLRGGKMLDVIFGGSDTRKQRSYCEVALVFDNSSAMLSTDFAEVHIARKLYRSGESEYSINKAQCRLKDILEMFRDTGIGKEGYSIIGQGKIDEILTEKSTERRKIFEEAAGIMKYRVRKEEAERKLDRTHDNLVRVKDILRELETQIEPLKKQCEQTKKYVALADRQKTLEINQYLVAYDQHSEKIGAIKATIDALSEEEADLKNQLEMLEKNSSDQEETTRQMDDKVSLLNHEITILQREIERIDGEVNVSNERKAYLNRDIERLNSEMTQSRLNIEQKQALAVELNIQIESGDERKKQLEDKIFEQQNRLTENVILQDQQQKILNDVKNGVFENLDELSKISSDLSVAMTEQTSAERRLSDIETQVKASNEEILVLDQSTAELEEQAKELTTQSNEMKQTVFDLNRQYKDSENTLSMATTELYDSEKKLEGIASRIRLLTEMKESFEGYFNSVKNLLLAADKNPALKSRMIDSVASAIRVPGKFEVAVEVALGNATQNIIVEKDEDAKALIDYLKKNDLGRVTFLPLNVLKRRCLSRDEQNLLSMNGVLGVASDLVEYDASVGAAVEYLLSRTVIVDNMSNAMTLMKRAGYSFRTVTLDGSVLNPGGVITGGSMKRRQTSLLSRERALDELAVQEKALKANADQLRVRFIGLREEMKQIDEKRLAMDEEQRQKEVIIASMNEKIVSAKAKKDSLSNTINILHQEEERIKSEHESSLSRASLLKDKQTLLKGTGDETDEKIKSMEDKFNQMKVQIDGMKEALSKDQIAFAEMKKELDSKRSERKRYEQEVIQSQNDIERKMKQIEACKTGIIDIDNGIIALNNELVEKQKLTEEKQTLLENTMVQRGEVREIVRQKLAEKETLHERISQTAEKKYKAELNISKIESNLEFSQNQIWDKYQLTYVNALKYKQEISLSNANKEIEDIKRKIRNMGDVNPHAIEDYDKLMERFTFLAEQKEDLEKASADLETVIAGLMVKMKESFEEKFKIINQNFKAVFKQLFGGGHVDLVLEDKTNIMESGIQIVAEPPGKHLQNILLLSGGEKALTAIALLFALLNINPSPLCILDEIDSALDDANTNKLAEYLQAFTNETQFIVITHRKPTMAVCDVLYGLAMEEKGVTEVLSVNVG